ncbi:hypothetical protein [African swine fever virus]|nr:hypothetical protein [African swine fever virus]UNZ12402.1 hypothetical protein [African swine fever virus]
MGKQGAIPLMTKSEHSCIINTSRHTAKLISFICRTSRIVRGTIFCPQEGLRLPAKFPPLRKAIKYPSKSLWASKKCSMASFM